MLINGKVYLWACRANKTPPSIHDIIRLWQNMKLDLEGLTVDQLTSSKGNCLYFLRILFEIGFYPLTACLIVIPICHNCLV